jgi:hypothetical protein
VLKKKVNIELSAHNSFLDYASSGTLNIDILESRSVWELKSHFSQICLYALMRQTSIKGFERVMTENYPQQIIPAAAM